MQIHVEHNDTMKITTQFFKKIYLSLYLKGFEKGYSSFYYEWALETEQDCNILTPTLMAISVVSFLFSRAAQSEAWGPTLLGAGFLYRILSPTGLVSKLTDFLSSPSYIIVQSPTQYLPITGHRDVSLPLSLEWHVRVEGVILKMWYTKLTFSLCKAVIKRRSILESPWEIGNRDTITIDIPSGIHYLETKEPYSIFKVFVVWHNLGLNPSLLDHWWTLYPLGQ